MADAPLRVGDTLEAYAAGYIKADGETVQVEAIGADWVVVRGVCYGQPGTWPYMAHCQPEELIRYRQ